MTKLLLTAYLWLAGHAERGGLKFVASFAGGAIIVTVALNLAAPSTVGVAVVPGSGGDVVAFEPGTGFNVGAYCKSAKTVYVDNSPAARESLGVRRVAANVKDVDYIEWGDDNATTNATRFYVDKQGHNAHELVQVVTADAVACLRAQR